MSVRILVGDAREALATLPDESVDCCVTSPPYLGLRDYGVEGQIGREPSVVEYVEALVSVFREVHRVLNPEGTVFLNLGDSYAGSGKGLMGNGAHADIAGGTKQATNKGRVRNTATPVRKRADRGGVTGKQASNKASLGAGDALGYGLPPKNLMMVPNRVAIALQDDGWWVRSEIIWGKPNPMPESVRDRPSTAHEKIWMLTKSARHYYDNEAGQFPVSESSVQRATSAVKAMERGMKDRENKHSKERNDAEMHTRYGYLKMVSRYATKPNGSGNKQDGAGNPTYSDFNARWKESGKHKGHDSNTGFWNRWKVNGGGPSRRLRNYEEAPLTVWRMSPAQYKEAHFAVFPPEFVERCLAIGCPAGGVVLDPFGGAGTTGLVADRLGYDAILCELNPEYASLAVERIEREAPLTSDVRAEPAQEALL